MNSVRLDRLLANLGYGSRSEVRRLVVRGAVMLGGRVITRSDAIVTTSAMFVGQLTVAGEPLDPLHPLTIMMHKPAGYVCSHADSGRSVYDLLPPRWRLRRPVLASIGRLDADTTGLLLITDDGELSHAVTSPRRHLPKRYIVDLALPLGAGVADLFASGCMTLAAGEKPLAPACLHPLSCAKAMLVLTEGRHHQVKRMFDAVGNRVVALHRDKIGGLGLPDNLAAGDIKVLDQRELGSLFGDQFAPPLPYRSNPT